MPALIFQLWNYTKNGRRKGWKEIRWTRVSARATGSFRTTPSEIAIPKESRISRIGLDKQHDADPAGDGRSAGRLHPKERTWFWDGVSKLFPGGKR